MYHRAGSSEQSETHARRVGGQGIPRQGGRIGRESLNVAVKSALQNVDQETEAGSDSEEVKQIKKGLMNRAQALALMDKYLEQDDERNAVAIARALVGVKGGLRAFGTAQQVPQRQYTLQDLRLNKIEPAKFLSPTDSTLGKVRTGAQVALLSGIGSLYVFGHWDMMQLLGLVVALLFVGSVDQVSTCYISRSNYSLYSDFQNCLGICCESF
jgi:ribosomal protein L30/L7E